MATQPTIRSGERIPHLDGTNDHLLFDREFVNKLISVANAVLNDQSRVITDHGIINQPVKIPVSKTIIPATFYNIGNWKTFQFRRFVFGGRSKWKTTNAYGNFNSAADSVANGGNWEIKMFLDNDLAEDCFSQPVALATQGTIAATTDTVIYDLTISGSAAGTFGQIILNDSVTSGGSMVASFWLEVLDSSAGGYYARVMARMSGALGQPANAFPDPADNIIPLCIISANKDSQTFVITPIQTGNLVNRYPPGTMTTRGDWTADALSGQYFFPGDLVTNGAATLDSSLKKTYIRKTFGKPLVAPAAGADWTALIS